MGMKDAQEWEASRNMMCSKKCPCRTYGSAYESYGAVVVADQEKKCFSSSKEEPLIGGVVRIHPSLRGSVDFLGRIKSILTFGVGGLRDGALHLYTHGIVPLGKV